MVLAEAFVARTCAALERTLFCSGDVMDAGDACASEEGCQYSVSVVTIIPNVLVHSSIPHVKH
jgi:hypothetical protein